VADGNDQRFWNGAASAARLGADLLSEEQYGLVCDEIATGVAAVMAQLVKAAV
jgi:hypothetical protein